jgi:tetraacyldisaccharide 4'-kinase
VSVGNLRVGGSGKTPVVELLARMLVARGGRPAVLTRGYRRRLPADGVTVVSDGARVLAGIDSAGDEPLMLARAVRGLIVVVGADRFLSGCLAERRLGAGVHILDDGFQHVELARTVDLLLVDAEDLDDRPLPAGWLREPREAAARADAAIVAAPDLAEAGRVAAALGVATAFRLIRTLGRPRLLAGEGHLAPGARVFAVAGIARPHRFFEQVAAAGWPIVGTAPFADHHRFTAHDIDRMQAAAASARAQAIVTTEKDAVRLDRHLESAVPFAAIPLAARIEPADVFDAWLFGRLT